MTNYIIFVIKQEVEAFKIQVSSFSKQLDEKQRHLNTVETSLEQANKVSGIHYLERGRF